MSLTNEIERLSKVHSSAGVLSLHVSVDPTISYRRAHELAAAKAALRENERYGAVVVSKEDARLLIISMSEVEKDYAISDSVPVRHDRGGWSQARYGISASGRECVNCGHLDANIVVALSSLQNGERATPSPPRSVYRLPPGWRPQGAM